MHSTLQVVLLHLDLLLLLLHWLYSYWLRVFVSISFNVLLEHAFLPLSGRICFLSKFTGLNGCLSAGSLKKKSMVNIHKIFKGDMPLGTRKIQLVVCLGWCRSWSSDLFSLCFNIVKPCGWIDESFIRHITEFHVFIIKWDLSDCKNIAGVTIYLCMALPRGSLD